MLSASDAAAFAPSNDPSGDWTVVGGQVNAVTSTQDAVYLGGSFRGLARRSPGLAAFEPGGTGDFIGPAKALDPLAGTPIRVTAITPATGGGLYVAGDFAGIGGVARPRVLKLGPDGALDEAFKPQLGDSSVTEMALGTNNVLYLLGPATIGDPVQQRNGLAAVNALTGAATPWNPSVAPSTVDRVTVSADAVYLGGSFTSIGGQARTGAAAVNLSTGGVLGWDPQVEGGTVGALALDGSTVYLGGNFTSVGGEIRSALAAVDGAGAGALKAWNPSPSAPLPNKAAVSQIKVGDAGVYVLGNFSQIGGAAAQSREYVAALDPSTGEVLPWDPQIGPRIGRTRPPAPANLAPDGDRVHIIWTESSLRMPTLNNDDGAARCGLASVDATSGAPLPWNPSISPNVDATCAPIDGYQSGGGAGLLAVADGKVWAGGTFTLVNVRRRYGLAAVDPATGQPLPWAVQLGEEDTESDPNTSNTVLDLAPSPDGSTIYIAGTFSKVNGVTRANAAAVRAALLPDGAALTDWDPGPSGPPPNSGLVRTLAPSPDGTLIYLGGDFEQVRGATGRVTRARLAAVESATGTSTGRAAGPPLPSPSPGGGVFDLLIDPNPANGRLFVAGQFNGLDTAPSNRVPRAGLAAVNITPALAAPAVLDWDARLAAGAEVQALAVRDAEIVVGGKFATEAGGPINLAAFGLTDAKRTAWSPTLNGQVETVTIDPPQTGPPADPADGTAYITGRFTTVGGEARSGAAAVDVNGKPTGWDPSPGNIVGQTAFGSSTDVPPPFGGILLLEGQRLLLTGAFKVVGDRLPAGFAFFGAATPPTSISAPSIQVGGTPPVNGIVRFNDQLTCTPASFGGGRGTLKRQWLRVDAEGRETSIPAADRTTYRVKNADTGSRLRCRETMINAAGAVAQDSPLVSVQQLPPELDSPPEVTGQPWAGGTAECTTGLWRNVPTKYTYEWFLDDGGPIAGATSGTLGVTSEQLGHTLSCAVQASNDALPNPAAARSAAVTITQAPPASGSGPRIAGDPRVGSRLTCEPGPWERARGFAYQWLRDRVPLVAAASSTYVATTRDLGKTLSCLVTADNDGGTTDAESAAVVVLASARSIGTGRRLNRAEAQAAPAGTAAAGARRIDIRGIRLRRGRMLAVTVLAPGAGRISVIVDRSVATKATGSQPAKKSRTTTKSKTVRLASGSRTVRIKHAARATVQLKLSASARRLIVRAGRVGIRITVRVGFRPSRGTVSSDRTTTTLRR